MLIRNIQKGFTLVEIAIVLLIVTIILGYTMAMVPVQQELKQYKQADAEMNKITEALYAFAQVNGYLPCPAYVDDLAAPTVTSNGLECRDNNGTAKDCDDTPPQPTSSCDVWFGYVPGKTLGIEGKYSAITGLLLDPWGKPYIYQVTNSDDEDTDDDGNSDGDGTADFVLLNGIKTTAFSTASNPNMNLGLLRPDLDVCYTDPSPGAAGATPETSCGSAPNTLINDAPAVILSTGKDANDKDDSTNSWIQRENLDNGSNDTVFVKTTRNGTAGGEFDDLVKWIAPNILYSKMIEANQLP